MTPVEWHWDAHRWVVDRLGWQRPFSAGSRYRRLLFVSAAEPGSKAQLFPFWHYRAELAARCRIEIRELPLARFEDRQRHYRDADAVCFQAAADCAPETARALAEQLREAFPKARLAYLDGAADTQLHHAESLDDHIAVYVKKQVLKEARHYQAPTAESHPAAYYTHRYGLNDPVSPAPPPPGFRRKLCLGAHVGFSPYIRPYFLRPFPRRARPIDLHARFGVKGPEWQARMRQEASARALALGQRYQVVGGERVAHDAYLRELFRAKLCFSPFGRGEVCRRDFEALFSGSLLLKPTISHLHCYPDVFLPHETYVPLAWDFADLEEKVEHYLTHERERLAIVQRAFQRMADFFRGRRFIEDSEPFLERLGILD